MSAIDRPAVRVASRDLAALDPLLRAVVAVPAQGLPVIPVPKP